MTVTITITPDFYRFTAGRKRARNWTNWIRIVLNMQHQLTVTEALGNPNEWVEAYPREPLDAGDIGGDGQISQAWSRRFVMFMPDQPQEDGQWAVVNDAFYVVDDAQRTMTGPAVPGIERQTELMRCTDVTNPDGTERWSDYHYAEVDDVTPTSELARQLCEQAERPGWDGKVSWQS